MHDNTTPLPFSFFVPLLLFLALQSPTIINAQEQEQQQIGNDGSSSFLDSITDTLSDASEAVGNTIDNIGEAIEDTIETLLGDRLSYEELVSGDMFLTLDQFIKIRLSESPNDFGLDEDDITGSSSEAWETDELWKDAAIFQYELATSKSEEFHPYLICSTHPNLSGAEREEIVHDLFANTPDIDSSHYQSDKVDNEFGVEGGVNLYINSDEISCGVIRAVDDTIVLVFSHASNVIEENEENGSGSDDEPHRYEYLSVNPIHSSMKMAHNTVDVMNLWFAGDKADDIVSISSNGEGDEEVGRMQVQIMGLQTLLCPSKEDSNTIANDIKTFITEKGGENVMEASFYNQLVEGDVDVGYTERMKEWSDAVTKVLSWTKDDGSNKCLDGFIDGHIEFVVDGRLLVVTASHSFWEMNTVLQSLGISEEDGEICMWYLIYSLGLNPMICSLQPKTSVKTLCSDGTTDLSKCPVSDEISGSSNSGMRWVVLAMTTYTIAYNMF